MEQQKRNRIIILTIILTIAFGIGTAIANKTMHDNLKARCNKYIKSIEYDSDIKSAKIKNHILYIEFNKTRNEMSPSNVPVVTATEDVDIRYEFRVKEIILSYKEIK